MKDRNPQKVNPKLTAALARQQQIEQQLAKSRQGLARLTVASAVASDPNHRLLMAQIVQVKDQRHRHRLLLGRKRFSLKRHQAKLDHVQRGLQALQAGDDQLTAKLAALEKTRIETEAFIAIQIQKNSAA